MQIGNRKSCARTPQRTRPAPGLAVTLLVLALSWTSACSSGIPPAATSTGTATPQTTAPPARMTSPPSQGEPAEGTPGQVTIVASSTTYTVEQDIEASITNGRDDTVYTEDLRTSCTIAVLERQDQKQWTPLPDCGAERTASVLAIGPDRRRTIKITAESLDGALTPGTYRLTVQWRTAPAPEGQFGNQTHSQPFELG